jgi:N-acetylglutamate synthase-like GNAT family acetyltransferase
MDENTPLLIRMATLDDVDACQALTRKHRKWFPFVSKPALREAVQRSNLHVAEVNGVFAGFVSYRACKDGWQTVYELAVDPAFEGKGIGRNLLYSVMTPIRLKCPIDNTDSNRFYQNAGMKLFSVDRKKKRPLNIWHMRVLCIHVQGGNSKIPGWARKEGMGYGSRHDRKPFDFPLMLDIEFKKYEKAPVETWAEYVEKVKLHRPVIAMAADYFRPEQRDEMLAHVAALKALGVLRVMVCPKFHGAIKDIPQDCIVAVSMPSEYASFIPEDSELAGRKVHLLGGNPNDLRRAVLKWNVISADFNVHERNAQKGTVFRDGRLRMRKPSEGPITNYEELVTTSGGNIRAMLNEISELSGLPLFKKGLY